MAIKNVIIMSGVSGSGKGTYIAHNIINPLVVSTDHFFMVGREYRFNPAKLGEAHGQCLSTFIEFCRMANSEPEQSFTLVVDNTNTCVAECAPYYAVAQAYGLECKIIHLVTMAEECAKAALRNVHGVPLEGVMGQYQRLCTLGQTLPPWWTYQEIKAQY